MNQARKAVMIAPSILSGDFARIESEVRKIEEAGADMIHLDVMDGCFVPNITFGPKMVSDIRKLTTLPLDAHLMIVNPEKYAKKFIEAGADYVTFHYEAAKDCGDLIRLIKENGAKAGISINPDTPVESIADVITLVDLVLIMSVFPGFSGQKYIEGSDVRVGKVKRLLENNPSAVVQIDGGITLENAAHNYAAGADILVTGNTFFMARDQKSIVSTIKMLCRGRV